MTRLALLLATVKIAGGLALWMLAIAQGAAPHPNVFPPWFHLAHLVAFCGAGGVLALGGRSDRAAWLFGGVLVTFGSMFADPLIRHALMTLGGWSASAARTLYALQPIVFAPALFWAFAGAFPPDMPAPAAGAPVRVIARVLAWGAIVALVANLAGPAAYQQPGWSWVERLNANASGGELWPVLAFITIPAFPYLLLKVRRARPGARRRTAFFVGLFVVGMTPLLADVVLALLVPGYAAVARSPTYRQPVGAVVSIALLTIPLTTAYAVAVSRVFELRFVIRRAVRYGLARYTVLLALALPALTLVWIGYRDRHRPLSELLTVGSAVLWLLLLSSGTLLWARRRLLDVIDRVFFREHYDGRHVLMALASGSAHVKGAAELSLLVTSEIDRALHVDRVALCVHNPGAAVLCDVDRRLAPLAVESPLASLVAGAGTPFDVQPGKRSSSAIERLPESDRLWLAESRARLLVPLHASSGTLLAILVLGEKRSEAPFTSEDRQLLTAVAAAAALALENRLLLDTGDRATSTTALGESHAAQECVRCGRVSPRTASQCRQCGGDLRESLLPTQLCGKFAVERRLGAGGMGVVYRGRDLTLDRPVALKTLPRLSEHEALDLRREARAMASLEHPHLAVIYGAETWRRGPVLVLELLPGGTLAERLAGGMLPIEEVLRLARAMAAALAYLHANGVLHRDIKPSNIGYALNGTPKLMDFGLARFLDTSAVPGRRDVGGRSDASTGEGSVGASARGEPRPSTGRRFVGTTSYMAPEALRLERPTAAFDLWSLAVTLFEALTRRQPFLRDDLVQTVRAISAGLTLDLRVLRPDCPSHVAEVITASLNPSPALRPSSAAALLGTGDVLERVGHERRTSRPFQLNLIPPACGGLAPVGPSGTELVRWARRRPARPVGLCCRPREDRALSSSARASRDPAQGPSSLEHPDRYGARFASGSSGREGCHPGVAVSSDAAGWHLLQPVSEVQP